MDAEGLSKGFDCPGAAHFHDCHVLLCGLRAGGIAGSRWGCSGVVLQERRANMRKFHAILIALLLVFSLVGCAGIRKNIVKLSESDIKNIEAIKEASRNLLETWPTYSGIIQGYFHHDWDELPGRFIRAVVELDQIACLYLPEKFPEGLCEVEPEEGEPTDFELGYAISMRIIMLKETIRQIIKAVAPDLLGYLPALVGL